MYFWLFLRRYPFFRTLPLRELRDLFLAFFFSWSVFGFLVHLLMFDHFPSQAAGLLWAVFVGSLSLLYFVATLKDVRLIPAVGLLQLGIFFLLFRPLPTLDVLKQKITVDVFGIGIVTLLGFNYFGSFINTSGLEQIKLRSELALAQAIQQTLVPPVHYRTARCEVYGKSIPSEKVGGDLVEAMAADRSLLAYVADVSGHGIPAGVLMGMVKTAVRVCLLSDQRPAAFLDALNRVLPGVKEEGMYVTLACLRFDAGTAEVEYALAGHPSILHYRRQTGDTRRLGTYQLPLGILPAKYNTARVGASAGDIFAIVSDGFTELTNLMDEEFGLSRIEELLERNAGRQLPELFDVILAEATRYGKQRDDQTLLLARVKD